MKFYYNSSNDLIYAVTNTSVQCIGGDGIWFKSAWSVSKFKKKPDYFELIEVVK